MFLALLNKSPKLYIYFTFYIYCINSNIEIVTLSELVKLEHPIMVSSFLDNYNELFL